MSKLGLISTNEAKRLVAESGFVCTDPDSSDCGRTVIHSRSAGGFGADWDLLAAVQFVERSHSELRKGLFGWIVVAVANDGDVMSFDLSEKALQS